MDKQQILEMAKSDPRFSQAVLAAEQQIGDMPITPDGVDELVKMFEFALNHPDKYPQIRQAAIKDDYIDEGDMPPEFDQVFLVSILVLLYGMQERAPQREQFARGGLAQAARHLRAQGRAGDTMLAHINPREAQMLKDAGGGGSINPTTGLPEFFSLKKFLGAVLPIALTFIAPGIGTAIGTMLGASGTAASIIGGAVIGGASSKLSGGNALQGALMGGLGGGLGGQIGSAIAPEASAATQGLIGSGLVGGAAGAITGKGFIKGAAQGALGQFAGQQLGNVGDAGSALNTGAQAAGTNFGNMMAAGYDPKTSAIAGGLSGLAAGMSGPKAPMRPSDTVLQSLSNPSIAGTGDISGNDLVSNPTGAAASGSDWLSMKNIAPLALAAGALGGQQMPPAAQQAVSTLSPSQQEYFNRPSITMDWDKMQKDAATSGLDLPQFMARNWNQVSSGAYANQAPTAPAPVKLAGGGALSQVAAMARGAGSGRDDTIDARLSDGEYVMDAETVALLGDGSTKEGARRLDMMREQVRAHKGKALSKGHISPDAKSPLAYLKGA